MSNSEIRYTMKINDGQHPDWVEDVPDKLHWEGAPDVASMVSPVDRAKATVSWWNRGKSDGEPVRKLVAVYMVTTEKLNTR